MTADTLKLKRQIRDWYNKHVTDKQTIKEVGKVIGFNREVDHNAIYSSVSILGSGQDGYNRQG